MTDNISPFHALYTAADLSKYAFGAGAERLLPALASAKMEVYPFQIAAAGFALRSPFLKGAILADEGSLGKTYEALIVLSQLWYEGKEKILLTVPTPLLAQWRGVLEDSFSLPFVVFDRETGDNPDFDAEDAIVLTTYDYAFSHFEKISEVIWDVAAFDEAHRLSKCYEQDNRAAKLKTAVGAAFKLLLTASPMRNSIMDLYGLIYFIDEHAFEPPDEFYKRYFRKPENYCELSARASYYSFRTLRAQVANYVKIPQRLVVTANYTPSVKERRLASMLDRYLKKPIKTAFPKMDAWELTLMLNRAISSSAAAFAALLESTAKRVNEPEIAAMLDFAREIPTTAKAKELLKALKFAMPELRRRGAAKKAVIFTENRATQDFLNGVLTGAGYKTAVYNGDKSRDYGVIEGFHCDESDILIATDVAAEGFNLEFCSFVVNFDIPYNIQTLEQRIMRCHRQGQKNDVVVLNFLNNVNIADVRTLELINKRAVQFDGIVGASDDVAGNFAESAVDGLTAAFAQTRTQKEIDAVHKETLIANEDANSAIVASAENALFTTFTAEIARQVTITPQYVKDKTAELNSQLWDLVKWFFGKMSGFVIDEDAKTLRVGIQPPKVFTGASLRRREYSFADKSLSVASSLARNVINETFWRGVPEHGEISFAGLEIGGEICYYKVSVGSRPFGAEYYIFAGRDTGGGDWSDEECRRIMELPVAAFSARGGNVGERDGLREQSAHRLDGAVDLAGFVRKFATETDAGRKDEITRLTETARLAKNALYRDIERLKRGVKQASAAVNSGGVADRISAEKRKATQTAELKRREQSAFMDGMRVDVELEENIKKLTAGVTAKLTRLFTINVRGVK